MSKTATFKHFLITFHLVWFQWNLINKFRENLKLLTLASKMSHLIKFEYNNNFLHQIGSVTYMYLLHPKFIT